MSAYTYEIPEPSSLKAPLITSGILHLMLFVVAAVGFPFMSKPLEQVNPISIELVDIGDITQTDKVVPPKKQSAAEKPKPVETKPDPEPPKPEPELVEPEAPKIEEKKAEPEKKIEKPKEKPKKKEEPKEKNKPKKSFDSLLNNIAPDVPEEPAEPAEDRSDEAANTSSQIAPLGERLTISERDAIGVQLYPCWNVPAGAKYAEDLVIEIRVFMNRDGSIRDSQILDRGRYNRDSHFRAAAESAQRALRNPRCTPLRYPPEKYDQLKQFVFRFDPRDIL